MKQDTLEGRAKTKNGVKRLCFSAVCILLEAAFIIAMITKLNQYAEIINLMTRLLAGVLVLKLYASDQTSSMKMPWVILILVFPILGVGLYLLIGLNGGTRKMRERYDQMRFLSAADPYGRAEEILHMIITMGNHMKLSIIAEGVETEPQKVMLQEFGCNKAQGYFYARPMREAEYTELLRKEKAENL